MNNEHVEIRLVNISDCGMSLKDTQGRFFTIPFQGQVRIGLETLQAILDEPVSKKMICKGGIKVMGATEEMLTNALLTDEERNYILGDRIVGTIEEKGITVVEVIEEESGEVPITKPITFYNWIKNGKDGKIRKSLENPINYDTFKEIVEKSDKYKNEMTEQILKDFE